jgi:hypothetical protein
MEAHELDAFPGLLILPVVAAVTGTCINEIHKQRFSAKKSRVRSAAGPMKR